MAVAGGSDCDAGRKIVELVAVYVGDDDAASSLGYHRIGARIGRRNIFSIAGEHALGVGAGQGGFNLWSACCGHGFGGHGILRGTVVGGYSWPRPSRIEAVRLGTK